MPDGLPQGSAWKWILGAVALGLLALLGDAIGRSIYAIRRYGFLFWLKSLFKMEPEQFRVVGVLILLVVAMTLMWLRGGG